MILIWSSEQWLNLFNSIRANRIIDMKRAHANQKIEMIQCGLYYKLRIGVFAYSETNLNNRTPIYRRKQEHLLVHFFLLFFKFWSTRSSHFIFDTLDRKIRRRKIAIVCKGCQKTTFFHKFGRRKVNTKWGNKKGEKCMDLVELLSEFSQNLSISRTRWVR